MTATVSRKERAERSAKFVKDTVLDILKVYGQSKDGKVLGYINAHERYAGLRSNEPQRGSQFDAAWREAESIIIKDISESVSNDLVADYCNYICDQIITAIAKDELPRETAERISKMVVQQAQTIPFCAVIIQTAYTIYIEILEAAKQIQLSDGASDDDLISAFKEAKETIWQSRNLSN